MNSSQPSPLSRPLSLLAGLLLALAVAPGLVQDLQAQEPQTLVADLRVEPAELRMSVGDTVDLQIQALDDEMMPVDAEFRLAGPMQSLWMSENRVAGLEPGEYTLRVQLFPAPDVEWLGESIPSVTIPVTVLRPGLSEIQIEGTRETLFQGTTVRHRAHALLPDGTPDPEVEIQWRTSDPSIAQVSRYGHVTALETGTVTITGEAEGVSSSVTYQVEAFPATRLEIDGGREHARTGDVLTFQARAYDPSGQEVEDLPLSWSHTFEHGDPLAAPGVAGGVVRDGRFVAEVPGLHSIQVNAGPLRAEALVEVEQRDVIQELEILGQGAIDHTRTTDFWVFEGMDGRDYAISGSKDVGGQAYVWDVTDPTNLILTDSILVDARSVNDVKVSPDARYAAVTREGASDRRNGVVILDLSEPAHPVVAAEHTEGLTGGVHNSFPTNEHLFALSAGEKYVIIDVTDIYNPRNVGEFQQPNARIHDVWVHDGIAYSAQRPYGVVAVDVGNGQWGGSPENPVLISTTGPMPDGGGFHAIFPYASQSTDRFYLFIGDEIMNRDGRALQSPWARGAYRQRYDPETGQGGVPLHTSGYIHIVDFTDPENPEKVAKYHVPDYGTHNIWIEDDILYQAYYEGGLRLVDVSGELMGDLYRQGREIAAVKPADPNGYVPNATMVWSAMPFKGNIFLTDTNSGLWSVQLQPRDPVVP